MLLPFSERVFFLFYLLRYLSRAQAEGDEFIQPRPPVRDDEGGDVDEGGIRGGRVGSLWGPKVGLSWGEDLGQEADDVDWLPKDWEITGERWGGEADGRPVPMLSPSLRNWDMKILSGPGKKAGGVGDYPDDDYYDYQSEKQMLKRVQATATPRQGILGQAEAAEEAEENEGVAEERSKAGGVELKVNEGGYRAGAREKAEEVGGKALQAGVKALEAGSKAVEVGFKAFGGKCKETDAGIKPNIKAAEGGASGRPVVKAVEGGASGMPVVKAAEDGAGGMPVVKAAEGGASGMLHLKAAEGGAGCMPVVKAAEGGAGGMPVVKMTEGGASGIPHFKAAENGAGGMPLVKEAEGGGTPHFKAAECGAGGMPVVKVTDGGAGGMSVVKAAEDGTGDARNRSDKRPLNGPSSFEREILSDLLSRESNNTINSALSSSDSYAHDEDVSCPISEAPTEKVWEEEGTQENTFSEEDLDVLNVLKGLLMSLNTSEPFASDDYPCGVPLSVSSNCENSYFTSGSGISSENELDRQKSARTIGGSFFNRGQFFKKSAPDAPSEESFMSLLRNVRNMLNTSERKELEKFLVNALRARGRKCLNPRRCSSPRLGEDGHTDEDKDEFIRLKLKGLKKHKKIGKEIERVLSKILTDDEDDHLVRNKIDRKGLDSEKQSEKKMRRFHGNDFASQKELHDKVAQNTHLLLTEQDRPGYGYEVFYSPIEIGMTENMISMAKFKDMKKNLGDMVPFGLGSSMKPCTKEEPSVSSFGGLGEFSAVPPGSRNTYSDAEPLSNMTQVLEGEKMHEYLGKVASASSDPNPVCTMRTLSRQFTINGYFPPTQDLPGFKALDGTLGDEVKAKDAYENTSVKEEIENFELKQDPESKESDVFKKKKLGIVGNEDDKANRLLSFLKFNKHFDRVPGKLKSSNRETYHEVHLGSLPEPEESRMKAFKKEMHFIENVLSQDYDYGSELMKKLRQKPEGKRPHWLSAGNP